MQVREVSHRLLQLYQLLGGDLEGTPAANTDATAGGLSSSEVVFMVMREPALLTASFGQITRRLLEMKASPLAAGGRTILLEMSSVSSNFCMPLLGWLCLCRLLLQEHVWTCCALWHASQPFCSLTVGPWTWLPCTPGHHPPCPVLLK